MERANDSNGALPAASRAGDCSPTLSGSQGSSKTMSPAEGSSPSTYYIPTPAGGPSTPLSEPPPPEPADPCARYCTGLWNGCLPGRPHRPHCRLRCPPLACKQCYEVADADWLRRGQWLEDCVSWDEVDDERQPGRAGSPRTSCGWPYAAVRIGGFAAICVVVSYWMLHARLAPGVTWAASHP